MYSNQYSSVSGRRSTTTQQHFCGHTCTLVFIYAAQVQTCLHLHVRLCVSTCERVYVSECVYSVGPWSLTVGLNQPSPVLFAQDMPQEAKTTVHVCPCCEPLLIHPTAAFLDGADTMFISVFIHLSYGICWITPSSPTFSEEYAHQEYRARGLKYQQINCVPCCKSDRQIPCATYVM